MNHTNGISSEKLPLDEAKDVSKLPYQRGLSYQEMQEVYGKWAADYEKVTDLFILFILI